MTDYTALAERLSRLGAEALQVAAELLRLAQDAQGLERHLAVAEVAERLSVSEDVVRDLIRAGRLPAVRVGNRTVIPESAVARFCAENTVQPRLVRLRGR